MMRNDTTSGRVRSNAGRRWRWRSVVGGFATLAMMGALLAACDRQNDDPTSSVSASQGPWTFTDDRGVEVTLDAPPERIVSYETAASALWYQGVDSVGVFGSPSLEDSPLLEGVDVSTMESLGEVYGEINLEKLAGLAPDLIVTAFNPDSPEDLWGTASVAQQEKMEKIAPIVAIDGVEDPTEVIARFADLAESVGADPNTPELVEARQAFDDAVAQLKTAVEENPGVQVLATGAYDTNQIYFAKAEDFPALREFAKWGVEFVPVKSADPYWDIVSFEQADKYPADLILHDIRTGALDLTALGELPTWSALPAVKADQLVPWQGQEDWSYQLYVKDVESLTQGIEEADPTVAS